MKLRDLIQDVAYKSVSGRTEVDVVDVVFDSRRVQPGSLFIAISGWEQDGHRFIGDAIRRGAVGVIAEREAAEYDESIGWVVVDNSRRALSRAAAAFFGYPAHGLRVIGVTGTDGKTTTTTLIAAMLRAQGLYAGMLSTIGADFGGRSVDTGLHTTTPDPVEVQRLLRDMVHDGMEYAVIETTSHALDQERTFGCEFDVAVATNVTPEHLDYHHSYGGYLATKARLFAGLTSYRRKPGVPKISVTNVDDVSFGYLRRYSADKSLTYGIEGKADVVARSLDLKATETRFRLITPDASRTISSPLLGKHNVYNMLAAATVAVSLNIGLSAIAEGAANPGRLTGRWEPVEAGQDFAVVVDFAHTPHALHQALTLARRQAARRVIVVFGCAGLRDKAKRPLMGEAAGRLADLIVLTAEDPRTEDVEEIIAEIEIGCRSAGRHEGRDYFKVPDRAKAIDFAISAAVPGDLVLLAGKGHERSLCVGETEHPWSDHAAAAKALARRGLTRARTPEEKVS